MSHDHGSAPTPQQAREALDSAGSVRLLSTRDLRVVQSVTAGVGVLMAILLLAVQAFDGGIGLVIGMGVYIAAIVGLLAWNTTVRTTPRGHAIRHSLGVAVTSAFYGLGIALTAGQDAPWNLVIVLAVLTALPTAVAAWSMGRMR